MHLMSTIFRWLLPRLVTFLKLPKRTIMRGDDQVYLERYYLFGEPGGLKYFPEASRSMRWWQKALTRLPLVYLHRFLASDEDFDLHNHPWEATSIILAGGYVEERRVEDSVAFWLTFGGVTGKVKEPCFRVLTVEYDPGDINPLRAGTFHRVTLKEHDCWTVIRVGKRVQSWGFWNRDTGDFLQWREHAKKREEERMRTSGFFARNEQAGKAS